MGYHGLNIFAHIDESGALTAPASGAEFLDSDNFEMTQDQVII